MKITREFLEIHKSTRGSWNSSQLAVVGIEWPPKKGWRARLEGKEITDEQARLFIEYGQRRPTGKKRKEIRQQARRTKELYRSIGRRAKSELERERRSVKVFTPLSDSFLESYEWRKTRMQVLKRDGARCGCCGATPADGVRMHVDHIKPRKLYPELALDLNNLQVLCEVCNHGKGNWDHTDWRGKGAVVEMEEWQRNHLRSIK